MDNKKELDLILQKARDFIDEVGEESGYADEITKNLQITLDDEIRGYKENGTNRAGNIDMEIKIKKEEGDLNY